MKIQRDGSIVLCKTIEPSLCLFGLTESHQNYSLTGQSTQKGLDCFAVARKDEGRIKIYKYFKGARLASTVLRCIRASGTGKPVPYMGAALIPRSRAHCRLIITARPLHGCGANLLTLVAIQIKRTKQNYSLMIYLDVDVKTV